LTEGVNNSAKPCQRYWESNGVLANCSHRARADPQVVYGRERHGARSFAAQGNDLCGGPATVTPVDRDPISQGNMTREPEDLG
jgi:hypothetical protein